MKKTTKKLSLTTSTIRPLDPNEFVRATGGVSMVGCTAFCSIGYTDCCFTAYTCQCTYDTARCEPSYQIC